MHKSRIRYYDIRVIHHCIQIICHMAKTTLLPKFLQLNQCIKPQPQTMTYQRPERKQVQDTIQQVLCNNCTLSRAMIYTIIPCLREVNIQ